MTPPCCVDVLLGLTPSSGTGDVGGKKKKKLEAASPTVLPLKEVVFPCCEVDRGQSTQTRDIKWVSGKEAVNILSKVSRASGELSRLPGAPKCFHSAAFLLGSVQGHTEHRLSGAKQDSGSPCVKFHPT